MTRWMEQVAGELWSCPAVADLPHLFAAVQPGVAVDSRGAVPVEIQRAQAQDRPDASPSACHCRPADDGQ